MLLLQRHHRACGRACLPPLYFLLIHACDRDDLFTVPLGPYARPDMHRYATGVRFDRVVNRRRPARVALATSGWVNFVLPSHSTSTAPHLTTSIPQ